MARTGELQRQILAPRGLRVPGLSEREIEVLRLLAEGLDTAGVAEHMCYSERTVKNVLHDITRRFNLRNRTQAVVFAMRKGLI
jgi:DNA-binding NarL/FixJ family response regulator